MSMSINEILKVIQSYKEDGREIYVVGGFVRDNLLGKSTKDIDIVCRNSKSLAEKIAQRLGGSFIPLDRKNGIYRVALKDNKFMLDVGCFTDDIKSDLLKRDFTVNAMAVSLEDYLAYGITESTVIDVAGGMQDLHKRLIVPISEENIDADPLRMLRAIRIAMTKEFSLSSNVQIKIKKDNHLLINCSKERIADELWQILSCVSAEKSFVLLDDLKVLGTLFPKMKELKATNQNFYHVENVFKHSLRVLKHLNDIVHNHQFPDEIQTEVLGYLYEDFKRGYPRYTTLKLAAFLHDIGKPKCMKVNEDGRITFHNHHKVGAELVGDYLKNLTISNDEKYLLKTMINYHMYPLNFYNNGKVSAKAMRRFVYKTGGDALGVLLLALADGNATNAAKGKNSFENQKFIYELLRKAVQLEKELKKLPKLLSGAEVMEIMGIPQSELVGEVLQKIKLQQVEGTIKNKPQAIAAVRNMKKKRQ
ncbi:HD domain-containing protein [Proteinivorax hydrogeniformans]|uniref:HD domain-containing protein n=1 Tax=Proteinivorax hydrogeniformans TaxID=1826727 RepID=A0AAU8HWA9_9FIRM